MARRTLARPTEPTEPTEPVVDITPTEITDRPTPTLNSVPTLKSKKATKNRNLEELEGVSVRSMSDAEKNRLIEALRDENMLKHNQLVMLDQNCQKAYEQYRTLAAKFDAYKIDAQAKLQFAKQAMSTCYTSIILAGNIKED